MEIEKVLVPERASMKLSTTTALCIDEFGDKASNFENYSWVCCHQQDFQLPAASGQMGFSNFVEANVYC